MVVRSHGQNMDGWKRRSVAPAFVAKLSFDFRKSDFNVDCK